MWVVRIPSVNFGEDGDSLQQLNYREQESQRIFSLDRYVLQTAETDACKECLVLLLHSEADGKT